MRNQEIYSEFFFTSLSSEIRGLRFMKCSSETLQNLPYFFISCYFNFFPNDCPGRTLVYVNITFIRGKNKVSRNKKRKKNYMGFRIPKKWQIFEAFDLNISSIINLLFLKSDHVILFYILSLLF